MPLKENYKFALDILSELRDKYPDGLPLDGGLREESKAWIQWKLLCLADSVSRFCEVETPFLREIQLRLSHAEEDVSDAELRFMFDKAVQESEKIKEVIHVW